jgi:signal transduction histidine kinase
MLSAIDFNAVRLAAALLFLLTSAAVWVVLYRQHDRVSVALWALGGMAFGTAMLSRADGNLQVQSAEFVVSGIAAVCGAVFRLVALRRDLGVSTQAARVVALVALISAAVAALTTWAHPSFALMFFRGVGAVLLGLSAWYAWQMARRAPSRNGQLLAALLALASLSYVLLCVKLLVHWEAGLVVGRWDYLVASAIAVVNGAYVNLAYVGLVLDRSRVAERSARDAQTLELARRESAESSAEALRSTLHQRDRLAAERGHLLQVLAHEIRQPLHNVNAALQAAQQALPHTPPLAPPQPAAHPQGNPGLGLVGADLAAERVQHAQHVLTDMQSVLENTLAVSSLLVREAPLTLQEVEIDFLLAMALGDLSQAERSRVSLQRDHGLHSVEVEPGLVRLALRNLLRNAFGHGGPGIAVKVSVEEQRDPPAWVLSVSDNGPGMSPAKLAALSAKPVSGTQGDAPADAGVAPAPQRGAGLFIVRRVMALHGGHLKLQPAPVQGLCARLVFPLPDDEPAAAAAAAAASQAAVSGARNT